MAEEGLMDCGEGWAPDVCGEGLCLGEEVIWLFVIFLRGRVSGGIWECWEGCATLPATLLVLSASFSSWRFTFYLIAFIAGMAVIVDVSGGLWEMGVGSLSRWCEARECGSLLF